MSRFLALSCARGGVLEVRAFVSAHSPVSLPIALALLTIAAAVLPF
jgi:hypothetical protein